MKRDLESDLRDWLRRQEPDPDETVAPLRAALERTGTTRQLSARWWSMASPLRLAAVAALAGLGIVAIVGWQPGRTPTASLQTPAVLPSPAPSAGVPSPPPSPGVPGPVGWFTFNWWREGSTVEGPQDPTGRLHLDIRAGVDARVTVDAERLADSPVPPVEEGAAPFASPADGSLLYGFTSTDGAELRQVVIADGTDTAVLAVRAAVPWATLDREAGRVYLVRFGLADRRYEGIWVADTSDGETRRLLAPSAGISSSAVIRVYLTPSADRLVTLECEPLHPCRARVWEVAEDRAGVEVDGLPFDDVYGLTDTEIIIGNRRVNLLSGAIAETAACGRGIVVSAASGPVFVYEADRPASSRCEGSAYRLVALDLATGRERQVWSSADVGADPTARLLVPDDGLGLFLPSSTVALGPEGSPPPDGTFLVTVDLDP